ncbi:SDR family NAD(P)-dependent oxidoreductase [Kribbella sp. NPDC051586]|uniref:SDR family NAD(P)-dependent oxidoreductase n=1 Tax=Kribbella sp. NPDC051586 TaxID=3364118 RepID=UPI0037ACA251
MRLDGAVVLVTGGASGLGQGTVRRLHGDGASVVVLDLPRSAGATLAKELGERVCFVPADVTDETQVSAALDAAAELGALRVVVNCAGVADPGRTLGREGVLPLEHFTRIVTINLVGSFNVIRLAAERMSRIDPVDGERGVIVSTASVAAFDGQIGQVSYSASKSGVAGMTLPLAREFASRQIRVMTIAPGLFETPMMQVLSAEARAALAAQPPHPRRLGLPAEYAALVAHIVANPMLNGEVIRLDGALRLAPR